MTRALATLALALGAAPAAAAETLAVLAVADPPGPDVELAEMTHQLRAACRDRAGGVLEVPEMRSRLLGQLSSATLQELERAYGGALATYQNGEYESSIRTLNAIVGDLEKLPEGEEAYLQWIRALLRLAHAEATIGHESEAREAMERVAAVEPRHQPDPEQYSTVYRREFEAARQRVAARPTRRIAVAASGKAGTVYVNGRDSGTTPVTLSLPPGRYRIGGQSGSLRVPSVMVDLRDEDRSVTLDFELAGRLRVNAGPGLALSQGARPSGAIRAGAWLAVDRVLTAAVAVENEIQFLVGTIYDARRGAIMREGKVRMVAGAVPSANLGALAAFLLTGQPQPAVTPNLIEPPLPVAQAASTPPPGSPAANGPLSAGPPPALRAPPRPGAAPPRKGWLRPAVYGAGALAVLSAGLATWQGLSAASAYRDASGMLRPDGALKQGIDPSSYEAARGRGDAASRRAWVGAGVAVLSAAAAGIAWVLSREPQAAGAVAFRF
jgi:hypothetical protein